MSSIVLPSLTFYKCSCTSGRLDGTLDTTLTTTISIWIRAKWKWAKKMCTITTKWETASVDQIARMNMIRWMRLHSLFLCLCHSMNSCVNCCWSAEYSFFSLHWMKVIYFKNKRFFFFSSKYFEWQQSFLQKRLTLCICYILQYADRTCYCFPLTTVYLKK